MKNILMSVFTILLIILIILLMVKGAVIGNITVLSISQIKEESKELLTKIDDVNTLNNITYKKALSDLNDATKNLTSAKSSYLDIASVSSDAEIKQANQEQVYSMEYLWSRVGNHATKDGVNIKMEITSSNAGKSSLNFTVTGSYLGIRNFIYSLENDSELNFKVEKFTLKSGGGAEQLNSTFTVPDISIKTEKNVSNQTSNNNNNTNGNNTTSDANNTNTTGNNTTSTQDTVSN